MRGAFARKAARGKTRTENSGWGLVLFFFSVLFLIRLLHLATVRSGTATAGTPDDVRSPGLDWLISAAFSVFALPPFHFHFLFLFLLPRPNLLPCFDTHKKKRTKRRMELLYGTWVALAASSFFLSWFLIPYCSLPASSSLMGLAVHFSCYGSWIKMTAECRTAQLIAFSIPSFVIFPFFLSLFF